MKLVTIIHLLLVLPLYVIAQTHTEKIVRSIPASRHLIVANINGSISIEGYDGNEVVAEVTKKISANTEEGLAQGKEKIQLAVQQLADTLILFIDGTCSKFGRRPDSDNQSWRYDWEDCAQNCRERFKYQMDILLKVPKQTNCHVSTINEGEIVINRIDGMLDCRNINGGIALTHVRNRVKAETINGDVKVEYDANPQGPCRFYTLNGDVNALFVAGLSANLKFESFNGDLYSNVPRMESLPLTADKHVSGKETKYELKGHRLKIGDGGVPLDFETFNGNVYLKEKN